MSNKAFRMIPFPENLSLIFFFICTTSNAQLWYLNITTFYRKFPIIVKCYKLIQKFRGIVTPINRILKPIFDILYNIFRSMVFLFLQYKHLTFCRITDTCHIIIMIQQYAHFMIACIILSQAINAFLKWSFGSISFVSCSLIN